MKNAKVREKMWFCEACEKDINNNSEASHIKYTARMKKFYC